MVTFLRFLFAIHWNRRIFGHCPKKLPLDNKKMK